ncbi:MAG: hypothetical protein ACLGPL_12320 [Acidobacteriota bacterium]
MALCVPTLASTILKIAPGTRNAGSSALRLARAVERLQPMEKTFEAYCIHDVAKDCGFWTEEEGCQRCPVENGEGVFSRIESESQEAVAAAR